MPKVQPQKGFASLVVILLITSASVIVGAGVAQIAFVTQKNLQTSVNSLQGYYAAEAGIEDAIYRIRNTISYSPTYSLSVDNAQADITVTSNLDERTVLSKGTDQGTRKDVQVTLKLNTDNVNFFFGVQVGDGGLTLGNNNSVIDGNVFSNGTIVGTGGPGKSIITGTAQVAATSTIQGVSVNGDAYADSLSNCAIGGTAYYVTTFGGDCTASSTEVLSPPLDPQGFPISQTQLDDWKADAQAGGTIGAYTLGNNDSDAIGPVKIVGDMTLGNSSTLTLLGTVWVTGTITFGNSVTIQLDPSFGSTSGIIIVDGSVSVMNGAILNGSGNPDSYLMLVSLFGPGTALDIKNSAASAIFYAPNGFIDIENGLDLREATGYGLSIGNNSSVTYDTGLASVGFSSGPGGSFRILDWKEK